MKKKVDERAENGKGDGDPIGHVLSELIGLHRSKWNGAAERLSERLGVPLSESHIGSAHGLALAIFAALTNGDAAQWDRIRDAHDILAGSRLPPLLRWIDFETSRPRNLEMEVNGHRFIEGDGYVDDGEAPVWRKATTILAELLEALTVLRSEDPAVAAERASVNEWIDCLWGAAGEARRVKRPTLFVRALHDEIERCIAARKEVAAIITNPLQAAPTER